MSCSELVGRGPGGALFVAGRHQPHSVVTKRVPMPFAGSVADDLRSQLSALSAVGHPNIVEVISVETDDEALLIGMPFATGGSLADALRRGPLDAALATRWTVALAQGLAAAHAAGVVHGDIKPQNAIFIHGSPDRSDPALSDFALARFMSAAPAGSAVITGTAEYSDPALGPGACPDKRSDVYSLGVVAYEAFAGRLPYLARTPSETVGLARRGGATPLAELDPSLGRYLSDLIAEAMSPDPRYRPRDGAELAKALAASGARRDLAGRKRPSPRRRARGTNGLALDPQPLAARHPPRENRGFRGRPGAGAIVAVALVVALGAWWATSPLGSGPHPRRTGPAAHGNPACPLSRPEPPAVPAAQALFGDVRGDGCEVAVRWSAGNVATVALEAHQPPVSFELGLAGDRLELGDWFCRGRALPALYRPSTGQVIYFDGWPEKSAPAAEVAPTGVRNGDARLVAGPVTPERDASGERAGRQRRPCGQHVVVVNQ